MYLDKSEDDSYNHCGSYTCGIIEVQFGKDIKQLEE